MMKRIIAGLFVLLLVMLAIVLVAPNFIDWNKHKDTLATHASAYLGRDVVVGGDISFRLLPNPQLQVDDVSVASIEGAKEPNLLKLKSLEARVRLMPLLEGRVEIEKIHLVEPQLTLEMLPDGRAGWHGLVQGAEGRVMTFGSAGDAVTLNDVTLRGGRVRYMQAATGTDIEFGNLNLSVAAPSLRGPYKITGDMVFRDVPVNVEITTGQAAGAQGLSVNALFQPLEKLPQMTLTGSLTSNNGAGFDGTLNLAQGAPASLFSQKLLTQTAWMTEDMTLSAALSARGGAFSLRDIDAQIGKQGKIAGSVTYERPQMEIPHLTADLTLSHIDLGKDTAPMPALPSGMQANIKLNGKTVKWRGATLNGLMIDTASQSNQWLIKSLRADLAGKAVFKASGAANPAQNTSNLKIDLSVDDVPAFAKAYNGILPERLGAFWPALPPAGLRVAGNLDLRGERASLYNFDAAMGDAGKASGVLNMLDDGIEARLNIAGLDVQQLEETQRSALASAIFAPGNDVDITGENIGFGGSVWSGVVLKASAREDGVKLSTLSARTGEAGRVAVQGEFSGLPLKDAAKVAINYQIAAPDAAAFAKSAGFEWPMPLNIAAPVDLRGEWQRGEGIAPAYKISGAFYGGTIDMQSRGADAAQIKITLPESHRLLALFGVDIDRLVSPAGAVTFTADRTVRADGFVLDGLRIETRDGGVTSGKIEKAGNAIAADLRAGKMNADRWLATDIRQNIPLSLKLRADDAVLRGLNIKTLESDMDVKSDSVTIKSLKGSMWDGTLNASGQLTRGEDKQWTASDIKGELVRFRPAQMPLPLGRLEVDEADVSFDLTAKAKDKTPLGDFSGSVTAAAPRLTVRGFDPAALTAYLEPLRSSPQDLVSSAHSILREGAATYRDAHAVFDIRDGKITARQLTLDNDDSTIKIETSVDAAAESYDLKAFLTLKNVRGIDPLHITRAGKITDAPDLRIEPKELSNFGASRIPPPEPEVEVTPVDVSPSNVPLEAGVAPQQGEMLPPGYLDVPGTPSNEAGDAAIGEILPVEPQSLSDVQAESLPAPEAPQPEAPAVEPVPPTESNPIGGILDRLGQ